MSNPQIRTVSALAALVSVFVIAYALLGIYQLGHDRADVPATADRAR